MKSSMWFCIFFRYKKNLKAFYIVHPTFWTKMMTWWFTTFMAPAIKHKVHSLPGVEHLYSVICKDQLEIPAYIRWELLIWKYLRHFITVSFISVNTTWRQMDFIISNLLAVTHLRLNHHTLLTNHSSYTSEIIRWNYIFCSCYTNRYKTLIRLDIINDI